MPDAVRHLSIVFDEDVSEADVLRLSVYFVSHATAKRGKTVPLSEAKKVPGIPLIKMPQRFRRIGRIHRRDSALLCELALWHCARIQRQSYQRGTAQSEAIPRGFTSRQTNSDSEVLLNVLAHELQSESGIGMTTSQFSLLVCNR